TSPPPAPPYGEPSGNVPPHPPAQPSVPPSLPGTPFPGSNPVGTEGPGRRFLLGVMVGALVAGGIVARNHDPATVGAPPAVDSKAIAAARASLLEHKGDVHQITEAVGPSVVSVQTRSLGLGAFLQAVPTEGAGSG